MRGLKLVVIRLIFNVVRFLISVYVVGIDKFFVVIGKNGLFILLIFELNIWLIFIMKLFLYKSVSRLWSVFGSSV